MIGPVASEGFRRNAPGAPTGLASPTHTTTSVTLSWSPPVTGGALDFGVYSTSYQQGAGGFTNGPTVGYCTAVGTATDAQGNAWSIGPTGPNGVYVNGFAVPPTNNVTQIMVIGSTVYQFGSGSWYSYTASGLIDGATAGAGLGWSGGSANSPISGVVVTGLSADLPYNFRVRVSNSSGTSAWSGLLAVTTTVGGGAGIFASPLMCYGGNSNPDSNMTNINNLWMMPHAYIGYWYGAGNFNGLYGTALNVNPNCIMTLGMPLGSQQYGVGWNVSGLLAGNYNAEVDACFETLRATWSATDIVIRPGWEYNLGGVDNTSFVNGYRYIVGRAQAYMVAHPTFKIWMFWCPNADHMEANGGNMTNFLGSYPGDDMVDIVGLDHYGNGYSGDGSSTNLGSPSILSLANFAVAHGKMFAIGETGSVGHDTVWPNEIANTITGVANLTVAFIGFYDAADTVFSDNTTCLNAYKACWTRIAALP